MGQALKFCTRCENKRGCDLCADLHEWIMEHMDAVYVVRCRECNHCDPENYHCDHPMGTAAPLRRKPDDFCSYGERKDGGVESEN